MTTSQRPVHPLLEAKLQLLEHIKNGNYQKIASLAFALSKLGKSNNKMYENLSKFVTQNKQGLKQMDSQEKQQAQPEVVNTDDKFDDEGQWNSDDQISYSQSQTQSNNEQQTQNEKLKPQLQNRGLFKQLNNIKSNNQKSKDKKQINKKSLSKNKNLTTKSTYQFKQPLFNQKKPQTTTKKDSQPKKNNNQNLHRNSAINKSKIPINSK